MGNSRTARQLSAFEEKMLRIHEATSEGFDPLETEGQKKERIADLLKLKNYDKFCAFYFPDYCKGKMAGFQKKAVTHLMRNKNQIHLWQWFREGAKSTHANIFVPLFKYYRGELKGMVCVSANEKMAARLLDDIKANFQANQRLIHDFGDRRSHGNWEEGDFTTSDGIAFFAYGKGQTVRGTRKRQHRPNYCTVDDLQERKGLKNDIISKEDYDFVKEDVLMALDTKDWTLVIPQNKFHKNCVTAKFEADEEIKVYLSRVNILDEKGESSWPGYISTDEAKAKIKASGSISSQRELFNTPIEEGKVFKRDDIIWNKRLPYKHYDWLCAYSDPSWKKSDKSDYKATVLIGSKGLKRMVLKAFVARVTVKQMFLWHYLMDDLVGDHALIDHQMEANFIQDMHLKLLKPLGEEKKRFLRLSGDTRSKPEKHQRIESMQPLFENELIEFNQAEKNSPGMLELINQLCAFEKGSSVHDDGPDAMEGALYILDQHFGSGTKPESVPTPASKWNY